MAVAIASAGSKNFIDRIQFNGLIDEPVVFKYFGWGILGQPEILGYF